MSEVGSRVVIGMDPHKRSATIEVMAADETVLVVSGSGQIRLGLPRCGVTSPRSGHSVATGSGAVEGCNGIGHHVAMRLLAAGQEVIDVADEALGSSAGLLDRTGTQD